MALATGAAILGAGLLGAAASESASRRQARAGEAGISANERALEQARADLQPFRETGERALDPLFEFVGEFDPSVERENIIRDVQRSAAARGKLRSGNTLMELGRQLFGLQQRNRAQRFSELFNVATLGANAASGQATGTLGAGARIGDLNTQIGNVRAAGTVGAANNLGNSLLLLSMLNRGGGTSAA